MMKRLLELACLVSLGTTVHANFEVMLFVQENRIVRYDPITRQQMGSFGEGQLGEHPGAAIAADPNHPGHVAVLNRDGVVRRFNSVTGAHLGSLTININPYSETFPMSLTVLSNGNFLVNAATWMSGQMSTIYSGTTGSPLATMYPVGQEWKPLDSVQGPDGNIYTINRISSIPGTSTFYTFAYTVDGDFIDGNPLGSSPSQNRFVSIGHAGDRILVSGNNHFEAASHALGSSQVASPVVSSPWSGGSTGDLAFSQTTGRTYMHELVPNGSGFSNRLNTYDPSSNHVFHDTFGLPYEGALGSMTIVTVPEPGTIMTLVAGTALLLRGRKRKS